eukprot:TRINITY_DN40768_c0_g1_i1.p1 TRINITY_DN40768_c0_g1~~TRINITY_DN40768_c0_g1_i1.p1  ORF type:complete len:1197 (+),score=202.44 TRINITY_DN40768_c0_g1_i1:57-3593(+)
MADSAAASTGVAGDAVAAFPKSLSFTVLIDGDAQPKHFTLESGKKGVVKVGRNPKSDLAFAVPGISWAHAELRLRPGGLWLFDVSTNGTGIKPVGADEVRRLPKSVETKVPDGSRLVLPMKVASGRTAVSMIVMIEDLCEEEQAPPIETTANSPSPRRGFGRQDHPAEVAPVVAVDANEKDNDNSAAQESLPSRPRSRSCPSRRKDVTDVQRGSEESRERSHQIDGCGREGSPRSPPQYEKSATAQDDVAESDQDDDQREDSPWQPKRKVLMARPKRKAAGRLSDGVDTQDGDALPVVERICEKEVRRQRRSDSRRRGSTSDPKAVNSSRVAHQSRSRSRPNLKPPTDVLPRDEDNCRGDGRSGELRRGRSHDDGLRQRGPRDASGEVGRNQRDAGGDRSDLRSGGGVERRSDLDDGDDRSRGGRNQGTRSSPSRSRRLQRATSGGRGRRSRSRQRTHVDEKYEQLSSRDERKVDASDDFRAASLGPSAIRGASPMSGGRLATSRRASRSRSRRTRVVGSPSRKEPRKEVSDFRDDSARRDESSLGRSRSRRDDEDKDGRGYVSLMGRVSSKVDQGSSEKIARGRETDAATRSGAGGSNQPPLPPEPVDVPPPPPEAPPPPRGSAPSTPTDPDAPDVLPEQRKIQPENSADSTTDMMARCLAFAREKEQERLSRGVADPEDHASSEDPKKDHASTEDPKTERRRKRHGWDEAEGQKLASQQDLAASQVAVLEKHQLASAATLTTANSEMVAPATAAAGLPRLSDFHKQQVQAVMQKMNGLGKLGPVFGSNLSSGATLPSASLAVAKPSVLVPLAKALAVPALAATTPGLADHPAVLQPLPELVRVASSVANPGSAQSLPGLGLAAPSIVGKVGPVGVGLSSSGHQSIGSSPQAVSGVAPSFSRFNATAPMRPVVAGTSPTLLTDFPATIPSFAELATESPSLPGFAGTLPSLAELSGGASSLLGLGETIMTPKQVSRSTPVSHTVSGTTPMASVSGAVVPTALSLPLVTLPALPELAEVGPSLSGLLGITKTVPKGTSVSVVGSQQQTAPKANSVLLGGEDSQPLLAKNITISLGNREQGQSEICSVGAVGMLPAARAKAGYQPRAAKTEEVASEPRLPLPVINEETLLAQAKGVPTGMLKPPTLNKLVQNSKFGGEGVCLPAARPKSAWNMQVQQAS